MTIKLTIEELAALRICLGALKTLGGKELATDENLLVAQAALDRVDKPVVIRPHTQRKKNR